MHMQFGPRAWEGGSWCVTIASLDADAACCCSGNESPLASCDCSYLQFKEEGRGIFWPQFDL